MTKHTYELNNLPDDVKDLFLYSHHANVRSLEEHRQKVKESKFLKPDNDDLFGAFADGNKLEKPEPKFTQSRVIWGTDNYESKGASYKFSKNVNDLSIIVPRVDKSKAEQKKRSKEKAEVFTPSWVCNVQNNLIDDHVLYEGAFNTVSKDQKSWVPSKGPVKFDKDVSWLDYVLQRRIEFTCGEGPYLMSPYDTTTGVGIPVRDKNGLFQRIGILDRKLRVVSENVSDESWFEYALLAMASTFGYEWQGDNLLLARLNFLNTFIEYYVEFFGEAPELDKIVDVAEIAAWNLWQMDGLKMIQPLSCKDDCVACKKKSRTGHNGKVSTIRFLTANGFRYLNFEDLLV